MPSVKREQIQHKFWLNKKDAEQRELIRYCEDLRDKDKPYNFVATIRDGLRIIRDLRDDNLGIFQELFPKLYEKLYLQMEADVMEQAGIQSLIEVKQLLFIMRKEAQQPKQIVGMIQPLIKPVAPPPIHDDDDLGIVIEKDDREIDVAGNFMRSMMNLQNS